jgi:hypothetical protein
MVSIIKNLDDMSLGLRTAALGLKAGVDERNRFSTAESSLATVGGVSYLSYYIAAVPNTFSRISHIFKLHVIPIVAIMQTKLEGVPLPTILGYLGMIASGFRFFQEGMSLLRQQQFLSIFERSAEQKTTSRIEEIIQKFDQPTFKQSLPPEFLKEIENRGGKAYLEDLTPHETQRLLSPWRGKEIRGALEEVKNLPATSLERALPAWLVEDITYKGGKDYLNILLKKVYKGDRQATAEANKLLETMRSFASKKQIVHYLAMAGAFIGAISCIGFLATFPLALTIAFFIAIMLIATATYMVRRGYVENRNGGFSFNQTLPAFLQRSKVNVTPQTFRRREVIREYSPYTERLDRLRSLHFQSGKRPLQHVS